MLSLLATSLGEAIPIIRDSAASHFLPELVLCVVACGLLLLDLLLDEDQSPLLAWPAFAGICVALFLSVGQLDGGLTPAFTSDLKAGTVKSLFLGMAAIDTYAGFFKIVFLFSTAITILLTYHSRELQRERMGEYYSLMFCSLIGMNLLAMSTDMLMIFLAIEIVSIPSYVLVGYVRGDRKGTEGALKYLLYGAFSSGVMLFGMSLMYGLTGTTKLAGIASFVSKTPQAQFPLALASLMVFAGFAYKLAAAPFHFWAPDVYQGAPTPITAWLSVASKAAGIAVFLRFILAFQATDFHFGAFDWKLALGIIAAVTMTVGNLTALLQTNVKRMLAYSSIAHVGYVLMAFTALSVTVVTVNGSTALQFSSGASSAIAFYSFAYMFMNLGAFAVVIAVSNSLKSEELESYVGLGLRAPALGIAMTIYLAALLGLPPTVGFSAKLQLFMAVINDGNYWLAVVAGLNTTVSAYYYMKVVRAMYLDAFQDENCSKAPIAVASGLEIACLVMVVPVVGFGLFFNDLGAFTQSLLVFVK